MKYGVVKAVAPRTSGCCGLLAWRDLGDKPPALLSREVGGKGNRSWDAWWENKVQGGTGAMLTGLEQGTGDVP